MLQMSLTVKLKHQSWYLESGFSQHMTGRMSMFQSLELKPGGEVKFGGNQKGRVSSGTIGNGNLPSISNVLLVEGLAHNLLSISKLNDNGYDIIFNQKSCRVVSQKKGKSSFLERERTTHTKLIFLILNLKT